MSTHALEKYLTGCSQIYATGAATEETAYYPVLKSLLDSAGGGIRPRVLCVMGMKNQGAGFPDGGLFTSNQFVTGADKPKAGQIPSRGVIECKSPKEDVLKIADTKQVTGYWERYNQVLVTNYREFLLVGREGDKPVRIEHFKLAESEADFWKLTQRAQEVAEKVGERFLDFLKRVILRPAPLARPKDLAWFLASYARDARSRIEHSAKLPALGTIRKSLEDALGLTVENAEGEKFFRSTLIQTLFYGVFAAWVLWHRSPAGQSGGIFDWEKASRYLHVPILRKLFRELTDPLQLDEVNLTEVMGWASDTLNRVNRKDFFAKFKDAETVQYFYEPFLEAFDPELRRQLGVWYTPPEVVKYMVARVDGMLRTDFNRPDGLADPNVYVLDPCCGTGAYIVEVLNTIANTLKEQGEESLLGSHIKKAAIERVFGFEILPAPFVVAHLQLGLFLQAQGAPLAENKKERAGVYLTNALTGWEPPSAVKQKLLFQEMEEERDAAEKVKQGTPILVVIGNPPYNGVAGMPAKQDHGLVEVYRNPKTVPKPTGHGLNDLYVRFFRVAERSITERNAKHGIVCYITNYSWLDGVSHSGLRERFLSEFDQIWIDNLNGDSRKNGKQTPEGKPDPSVFSTATNRDGIQVGTAVTLLARTPAKTGPAIVRFREFWGENKREELLESGKAFAPEKYAIIEPVEAFGLALRPMKTAGGYGQWPLLPMLFPTSFPGIKTSRDEAVIDYRQDDVLYRMRMYFDPTVSHEQMRAVCPSIMKATKLSKTTPTPPGEWEGIWPTSLRRRSSTSPRSGPGCKTARSCSITP